MTRSRLRAIDAVRLAAFSLRARRLRAALASLGVAVGVGSMVAVLALTASSEAELVATIQSLGTNLLTIQQGSGITGPEKELPLTVELSASRVEGVESVSSTAVIQSVHVLRTDRVPQYRTAGLEVRAAEPSLIATLQGRLLAGRFLTPATDRYSVAVLGYEAASALGISSLRDRPQVWLGGRWFAVAGILDRLTLAPEVDRAALIGLPIARQLFGFDGHATRVYVRADPERVATIARLLARTVDPTRPDQVAVSRPSDALTAQLAVASSATLLYLGLGAIALFVGAVGVANVMFVSVIERRPEIGLRRALGATRRHVAVQFLAESVLLAVIGGVVGAAGGAAVTLGWSASQSLEAVIPVEVVIAGILAAAIVGGIAGLYPALRATRVSPVTALRGS